jgi:hypothetical protein
MSLVRPKSPTCAWKSESSSTLVDLILPWIIGGVTWLWRYLWGNTSELSNCLSEVKVIELYAIYATVDRDKEDVHSRESPGSTDGNKCSSPPVKKALRRMCSMEMCMKTCVRHIVIHQNAFRPISTISTYTQEVFVPYSSQSLDFWNKFSFCPISRIL